MLVKILVCSFVVYSCATLPAAEKAIANQDSDDKPIKVQLKIVDDETNKHVSEYSISSGSLANDGKGINWWQGVTTKINSGIQH